MDRLKTILILVIEFEFILDYSLIFEGSKFGQDLEKKNHSLWAEHHHEK